MIIKVFGQVSGHVGGLGVTVCKTVGLAYDGSNPSPATTGKYSSGALRRP
jgi:hypothetical protein